MSQSPTFRPNSTASASRSSATSTSATTCRPTEVARAVDMANDLTPDLPVVTGDFVSSVGDPLGDLHRRTSRLQRAARRLGMQRQPRNLRRCRRRSPAPLPSKKVCACSAPKAPSSNHNGAQLQSDRRRLPARPHGSGGRTGPMLQEIEHTHPPRHPNILLSHNPNSFHRAAELGIELSLAGHTHGGQVKVRNRRPQRTARHG